MESIKFSCYFLAKLHTKVLASVNFWKYEFINYETSFTDFFHPSNYCSWDRKWKRQDDYLSHILIRMYSVEAASFHLTLYGITRTISQKHRRGYFVFCELLNWTICTDPFKCITAKFPTQSPGEVCCLGEVRVNTLVLQLPVIILRQRLN